MSNITKSKARQTHVSPGIYSREIELNYAVKSLGITKLGLVGETLRGRAFEPYEVADWTEFIENFGGLNATKFAGTQYPKYELPYIAKSYLDVSNQLSVCRVLGLSGYNAGPAWLVTASKEGVGKQVVAVLRARGDYKKSVMFNKNASSPEACACQYTTYDTLFYRVGEITSGTTCTGVTRYDEEAVSIAPYISIDNFGNECDGYKIKAGTSGATISINSNNAGQFVVKGYLDGDKNRPFSYPVSLNPGDKEYILNVLGTNPETGSAPVFVEALYDVNLSESILRGDVTQIDSTLEFINVEYTPEYCGSDLVYSFLEMGEEMLTKRMVGTRFICGVDVPSDSENIITVHPYSYVDNKPFIAEPIIESGVTVGFTLTMNTDIMTGATITFTSGGTCLTDANGIATYLGAVSGDVKVTPLNGVLYIAKPTVGQTYTVKQFTDKNAKRNYFYAFYPELLIKEQTKAETTGYKEDIVPLIDKLITVETLATEGATTNYNPNKRILALLSDGYYYRVFDGEVQRVTLDLNNYKSAFTHATTPWFVSQIKGDAENIELTKLFRFHTISDGNNSNFEIKVSVANVLPDEGTFDVYVRDINDSDASPLILEKYSKCTLVPGDKNYLGLKIGTIDDSFVQKSKYISVEISESDAVRTSVPCGFLGFPTAIYNGLSAISEKTGLLSPDVVYNSIYNEDIKNKKQYFGISDLTGVDLDLFTFKGRNVYDDDAYLGQGFHLDSRLSIDSYDGEKMINVTVDGETGYDFTTINVNSRTSQLNGAPIISNEVNMEGSIFENVDLRKFTTYFCGGFDGWDVYRDSRTNTDEFKINTYKGVISKTNGEGRTFERIQNGDVLGLEEPAITSDYYAYLSAIRQYANPEKVDINIFATPGIDYVNNTELVKEVIDMIEEERADSIYVVTTPDKPRGASDIPTEMFTADEAAENLEDSDIDSSYSCTYFPWVKFLDTTNNVYINLPVTKDVVRNMAETDNVAYPWYAPAGFGRGNVECEKAHKSTKLAEEDTLYNGYINVVKTFANEGVKIWGQKTMMKADDDTMLTRIAVRRLMLRLRKLVAIAVNKLIFDPNDPTTTNKFLSLVTPILQTIKENRGISDFRIKIDSSSMDTSDRRELNGQIFVKPYQALEYINIDYVLTPEGISFTNV